MSERDTPAEQPTQPQAMGLSRNVIVLGLVSFFTDVHSEMLMPLLPGFFRHVLRLNKTSIGIVEGVADATASLTKVVSGWWSDLAAVRKPFVIAGYTLSAASKPLFAFIQSGLQAVGVRFADRLGKGLRTSPRDALIADSSPQERRGSAFGFHRMADTSGAILGTVLAYVLLEAFAQDYRRVFLWATVPGVLAVLTLIAGTREVPLAQAVRRRLLSLEGYDPRFVLFLIAHTTFSLGNFTYAFFLLRTQELGVAEKLAPIIYLVYNIVYALWAWPAGALSDRYPKRLLIILAYGSYAATCLGLAAGSQPIHAWLLFVLYGIHSGTVEPVVRAVAADLVQRERRGTGLGLFHTLVGVAALPASIIAGLLADHVGPTAPFVFGAACALLGAILMWLALHARQPSRSP